jgi:diguanylate cyclase (GGDEF)-like protein/PAS domain S-box-containing protein
MTVGTMDVRPIGGAAPSGGTHWGEWILGSDDLPTQAPHATMQAQPPAAVTSETLMDHIAGLQAVFDQVPTGFVVAEAPSGRIVMFNAEAARILGHDVIPAREAVDYVNYGAVHTDGTLYRPDEHPLARALKGEVVRDETVRYRRGDGGVARLSASASPVRSPNGRIVGAVTTFIDVTERYWAEVRLRSRLERLVVERTLEVNQRANELDRLNTSLRAISDGLEEKVRQRTEELAHRAHHDYLTGLPNRALFEERLERAVASAQRYGRRLAVLFLDLDGFKAVNDTHGHDAGDRVLKQVASRLPAGLRSSDTLARFGGDEFVVLVTEIADPLDAREVALALLDSLTGPYEVLGDRVHLRASVGISVFPDDGPDASKLLRHADLAMYGAKEKGGSVVVFHTEPSGPSLPTDEAALPTDEPAGRP